jgi:RNA polymerase sigma factor (sigma-70 family)
VQSTFVNALRALQRGVVPISEEAWLFKIAGNVCLETHRANRRRREVPEVEELADPVAGDREPGRDVGRELIAALVKIPTNQRRALLLREWRGLSYREIAADMGCSVGAVETLIFRARRNVAQELRGERTLRARVAGFVDLGSLLSTLKTAFGSATAAKVAAIAAVVTVATIPSGGSPRSSAKERTRASAPITVPVSEVGQQGSARDVAVTAPGQVQRTTERQGTRSRVASNGTAKTEDQPSAESPEVAEESATEGAPAITPPPVVAVTPPAVPGLSDPPADLPDPPVELPDLPGEIAPPQLPQLPSLPLDPPITSDDLPELPELP